MPSHEETWRRVDQLIDETCGLTDDALTAVLAASSAAGLPEIQVSPPLGKLLFLLGRVLRAERILEIGALGGYSAVWLARALVPEGRLVTLESNPHHAATARENLARAGLSDRVEVREGLALDSLAALAAEGGPPFDLALVDADKAQLAQYYDWCLRLCRPGGIVVLDNVVRDGAVLDAASADPSVQGVREFFAQAAADPRATFTVLQTVGGKGYDGVAIAVVAEPNATSNRPVTDPG